MVGAAEADAIAQAGMAALERGDPQDARDLFQRLVDAGPPVSPPWLLLAQACLMAGDEAAGNAALDSLLALDPRNIRALVMKGDHFARAGDSRAMTSFYEAALKLANDAGPLPPGLIADLQRAEAATRNARLGYRRHLESRVTASGLAGSRVRESLDILFGEKEVYLQSPTAFFFPRLPHIQFYERADFPWLRAVEDAAPAMRAELEAVMREEDAFTPYMEPTADRPVLQVERLNDRSWTAFHLWRNGGPVAGNAERCPRTLEALQGAPLPRVGGRSPMILFSLLRPGAHIKPHSGMFNTRLICHIPLIAPPDCRFRVGNEVRSWEQGKALIFDDSIEHEAWNESKETRVILLFEIWRPELSPEERDAVTAIFESIDDYGAGAG